MADHKRNIRMLEGGVKRSNVYYTIDGIMTRTLDRFKLRKTPVFATTWEYGLDSAYNQPARVAATEAEAKWIRTSYVYTESQKKLMNALIEFVRASQGLPIAGGAPSGREDDIAARPEPRP